MNSFHNSPNVGCGNKYDRRWFNIDFASDSPYILAHNLLHGVPYANESFDVVNLSQVIEHFTQEQAKTLLKEAIRL